MGRRPMLLRFSTFSYVLMISWMNLSECFTMHMVSAGAGTGSKMFGPKIALVTGSTGGIGKHTAAKLASDGFKVLIHGRSQQKIDEALEDIKREVPSAQLEGIKGDFASLTDIQNLSRQVHDKCNRLDVLVNNAGVFQKHYQKSIDGNEMTFQINVLAPFLLTSLLLDLVAASERGRIVVVSSISQSDDLDLDNLQMEKGFNEHTAYSLSKLCNAMHAIELAALVQKKLPHVTVNTLDPGTVNTKLLHMGWASHGIDVSVADYEYKLATDPALERVTGEYFVSGRQTKASPCCYDPAKRKELWGILERLTGATYTLAK